MALWSLRTEVAHIMCRLTKQARRSCCPSDQNERPARCGAVRCQAQLSTTAARTGGHASLFFVTGVIGRGTRTFLIRKRSPLLIKGNNPRYISKYQYRTQLVNMSSNVILDITARVYLFCFMCLLKYL